MHRLTALGLLLALVGCDSGDSSSAPPAPPTPPEPPRLMERWALEQQNLEAEAEWDDFYNTTFQYGDTLVVGTSEDADSLNDLVGTTRTANDVMGLLFLTLTRTNPDFSPAPCLAESWEFSEDQLTLTFNLRDDVYWHDGERTTGHDVKFTYDRQTDPAIGWSAIRRKKHIKEVVVPDVNRVRFIFKKAYPYQVMDASVGYIMPKHLLEEIPSAEMKGCDFNREPVGNGPFKFGAWKEGQHIELEANQSYFMGRPPLNGVIFKVIPRQEDLVQKLKDGEIDCMEAVPPRFCKDLSAHKDLAAHLCAGLAYTSVGWNLKHPLFVSRKVRQALTHAINRQEIVDSLLPGLGEVCKGPIPPLVWAHHPALPDFPHDPAKARQMLSEEGWKDTDGDGWLDKDGKPFEFTLKTDRTLQDILVILQDQLKKVGIKVHPSLLERGDLNRKDFEAAIVECGVELKPDMTATWHSKSANGGFNFVSYANPEFDRFNDAAIFEMDQEKARKLWLGAQEMIARDQPCTFLYVPRQINFIHKRFRNVKMRAVGWRYNLEQWWVPKEEQKRK